MIQLIPGDGLFVNTRKNLKTKAIEARPKLNEFDYWIQLIGLICSFAGLSFHEFTSITIEFAASKVKRKKLRIALFGLKLVILMLVLVSFAYLSTQAVFDYKTKENYPTERNLTMNLIKPTIVYLAICVNLRSYLEYSYRDKTMSQIEEQTEGALNDVLDGIYTNYQGKSFGTNYRVQPKVLFFLFGRCFALTIYPNYQMILSSSKLRIKFKKLNCQVYVLSEYENLSSESFQLPLGYSAVKKPLKSWKKCVDYEKKNGNCMGRRNCVERCIGRKFMVRYNKTPSFSLPSVPLAIDRDWFSLNEWNTSRPMEYSDERLCGNISKECLQEIPDEKSCLEIKFEETVSIMQPDLKKHDIDLQFEVGRSVEESPSLYKLFLNLLTIQSIFFGLTVLKLLSPASPRLHPNKV